MTLTAGEGRAMTAIQADRLVTVLDTYLDARSAAHRPPWPGLEPAGPVEDGRAAREEARARVALTLEIMRMMPGPGEGPAGAWGEDEKGRRPA
jgi:hypothetical protein